MRGIHRISIDLALPPEQRWTGIHSWGERIGRLLLGCGGPQMQLLAARDEVMAVALRVLGDDHRRELEALAAATRVDLRALVLANATYDLVKFGIGCSALAVDTPAGPLHGRNLDWPAPDGLLAAETLVCDFVNAPAGPFTCVGWPGFIGALSAVAPGRFSVTLNAAFSNDPPVPRQPVALLLRRVLEEERCFTAAVDRLAREPIATDCLILVAGVAAGEMAVIERTPSRHAVRRSVDGAIRVTNDYVTLAPDLRVAPGSEIQRTSCGRYDRIGALLTRGRPASAAAVRGILADPEVRMPITVQRMLFAAASGLCQVEPVVAGV